MKKTKLPNLISVLILTLITAVMWVSFNIYRAISNEATPSVPKEVSDPLTPTLDASTISEIETRIFLDETQIPNTQFSPISTPVPTAAPTTIPSPSPIASPAESTESGTTTP